MSSIIFAVSVLGLVSFLHFFIKQLMNQIQLKADNSSDYNGDWYYGSIAYLIVTSLLVIAYIGYLTTQNCY